MGTLRKKRPIVKLRKNQQQHQLTIAAYLRTAALMKTQHCFLKWSQNINLDFYALRKTQMAKCGS